SAPERAAERPAGTAAASLGQGAPAAVATGNGQAAVATAPAAPTGRIFASPRARMIATQKGIDLGQVTGTGPGGRIMEKDVERAAAELAARPAPTAPPAVTAPPAAAAPAGAPAAAPVAGEGRDVPVTGMRRVIADRMSKSRQTVADVVLTTEVDMGEAAKLRTQANGEWEKAHGLKMTYTDIIVKAVAKALTEHRRLNSSWLDGRIREHGQINIGIAVALDDGLIVPVIRDADRKPLLEIARSLRDLGERARKGGLGREEVTGGTFTITNMGMIGVDIFTPIVNPPECAILGVGRIADRPVVRDGVVVVRLTMWLSLSFDHRVVDGAPAGVFLGRVKQLLESPYLLFV
ncbi:MAG: 2-oxo acid dehydrogenase subunit E2, partial [Chloroflexi bacterium]|nr:2-oxo acid dehydrogenase subunit E2 [Chloroflexota bacterium]